MDLNKPTMDSNGDYDDNYTSDDGYCLICGRELLEHYDYEPYGDTYARRKTIYCPNCD